MMSEIDKLPGMKESEVARLGGCAVCGEPLTRELLFYEVTLRRAGFDRQAIERRVGLGMALGSSVLAAVMGPDEDIAKVLDGPKTVAVHEGCAGKVTHLLDLMVDEK